MLIEMSRDPIHGGVGWEFGKCVWAPTVKENGGDWPFWNKVGQVKKGDLILHLRGKNPNAEFTSISIAASDDYRTKRRPPHLGQWKFSNEFFRADLEEYESFPNPIPLSSVFKNKNENLRSYFTVNRGRSKGEKQNLFYVIQSARLQYLNGAYLSDMDNDLASIILGPDFSGEEIPRPTGISVATGQRIHKIRSRVGQSEFSDVESKEFRTTVSKHKKWRSAKIPIGKKTPRKITTSSTQYVRDPQVVAFVEQRANGKCELCGKDAPFLRSDGSPFLEIHHIAPLSENGPDTVHNAAALCPNCHRECHHEEKAIEIRQSLKIKISIN